MREKYTIKSVETAEIPAKINLVICFFKIKNVFV